MVHNQCNDVCLSLPRAWSNSSGNYELPHSSQWDATQMSRKDHLNGNVNYSIPCVRESHRCTQCTEWWLILVSQMGGLWKVPLLILFSPVKRESDPSRVCGHIQTPVTGSHAQVAQRSSGNIWSHSEHLYNLLLEVLILTIHMDGVYCVGGAQKRTATLSPTNPNPSAGIQAEKKNTGDIPQMAWAWKSSLCSTAYTNS